MNYLTPAKLAAAAPAALPLPEKSRGLIDTAAFVKYISDTLGHRPVMAIQGKPHNDVPARQRQHHLAKRERKGRHMIVCADANGRATILLNSHTVRRKAWLGAGFFRTQEADPGGLLLVGTAIPLQRWRGPEEAVEQLERFRSVLNTTREQMRDFKLKDHRTVDYIAEQISRTAYLPEHKAIGPEQLLTAWSLTLYDTLFGMLARVIEGNLPAADPDRRKVKPVRGPDAIMHASNTVWNIGADLVHSHPLPTYRKT